MITQSELKKYLHYNPDTGIFTHRRLRLFSNKLLRSVAGCTQGNGYNVIRIKNKNYRSHKLAYLYVYGVFPDCIDHLNQDRSDNRISNLVLSTTKENGKNRTMNANNTSGCCGVYRNKKKWMALIRVNGKLLNLGSFKSKYDAIIARKMAEYEHGYSINHGNKKVKQYKDE